MSIIAGSLDGAPLWFEVLFWVGIALFWIVWASVAWDCWRHGTDGKKNR